MRRRPGSMCPMGISEAFEQFIAFVAETSDAADLAEGLGDMARRLGCDYFALTHHADPSGAPSSTIRLHN